MSIEMNRYTPLLSSFLAGVVVTLMATGSIKTHFKSPALASLNDTNEHLNPQFEQAKDDHTVRGIIETVRKDKFPEVQKNESLVTPAQPVAGTRPPAIKSKTSNASDQGLAATFKNMLIDRSGSFQVIGDDVDIEEAREQAYAALANMKSIQQGSGSHSIYVLFDPLCPYCHTLYNNMAGGWADTLDLTVNWIPAIAFLDNNESVLISQRLITALNADKQLLSSAALASLIDGDASLVLSDDWLTNDQAFLDLAQNTMALIQIGGGTPAVVFKTASGDVEIINGVPTLDDFSVLTSD